jgi:ribosomal protein L16 Arg81 hydroxylase
MAATPTRTTATPRRASRAALARCLDPVDAETFLAEHWERRPLVVPRDEPGRFDDLLSEADVERLVCSTAIRYPAFRLVREGSQLAVGAYTSEVSWRPPFTGAADVPRVVAEWEAGATIVLQALHVNWHPLAVFCRLLEDALGRGVQANSYSTPSGSQGFDVHHDTHDVLVLQVAGEKRWRLYDPLVELPLKHQRYSGSLGDTGPPTDDVVLRAGDTLYLPRGWLHEAETSATDSLHLTIGIAAHTWLDAARGALAALEGEPGFRHDVARGDAAGLEAALADELDPETVERRRRRRFLETRRPIREDGLTQLRALPSLGPDTPLERRETVIADLEETDGAVTLVFEGKEVGLPSHAASELRACFGAEAPFRAADLPGDLDVDGRLVLVRRLVREGFLRVLDAS